MTDRRRFLVAAILVAAVADTAAAAEREVRCVVVEVFARGGVEGDSLVLAELERYATTRKGISVLPRFIDVSVEDREALDALAAKQGFDPGDLPVVQACNATMRGAGAAGIAVKRLQAALQIEVYVRQGCGHCAAAKAWLPTLQATYPGLEIAICDIAADRTGREALAELVRVHRTAAATVPVFHLCNRLVVGFERPETSGQRVEQVLLPWTRQCRVPIGIEAEPDATAEADEAVDVPWLGRLDPQRLGMPLFTLAIGLIDGFNPCAMWVLLLLLSILVNLQSRWRILAVAGTFVMVSGAAYFAFMAAWLNVFEWVGMLRPVQVSLGMLAVAIGMVHVKDWFAPGHGPSLSIPESAKPGIYARIRAIVTAENLPAAMVGVFVLAVLVNVVELLCTAGLPALYTEVLSQRGYSAAARYGYLGLYIAAYMFDDTVMVAGVVATLSRCKLQETGGRWLKLVSGLVILALGLMMLLRPEWLEG
ncbi:MAG: NrdH-redoxin [Planctomycetia bacterium]|nr:NrdH-redoxin [Planctomycetia bacterium]